MKTPLESIAESLKQTVPDSLAAAWQIGDDSVFIEDPQGSFLIGIRQTASEWIVETGHGHAHRNAPDEAILLVGQLLVGDARFTQEFRGELHASSWLETREDEFFVGSDTSLYLNPFDADEWICWPGEQWTQVRYSFHINELSGQLTESSQSRWADEIHELPQPATWMEEGLGLADAEMKWTYGPHRRFVLQCPKGWRAVKRDSETHYLEFIPQFDGMVFRATNYFRETDGSKAASEKAVAPTSIQYSVEVSETDWSWHRWVLMFSDYENEMVGILELAYLPESRVDSGPYVERIKQSVSKSLFAPENWDMTRGQ